MLKIATWNMNHWRRSVRQRAQTWAISKGSSSPMWRCCRRRPRRIPEALMEELV